MQQTATTIVAHPITGKRVKPNTPVAAIKQNFSSDTPMNEAGVQDTPMNEAGVPSTPMNHSAVPVSPMNQTAVPTTPLNYQKSMQQSATATPTAASFILQAIGKTPVRSSRV